jgi:hypothetical protein
MTLRYSAPGGIGVFFVLALCRQDFEDAKSVALWILSQRKPTHALNLRLWNHDFSAE